MGKPSAVGVAGGFQAVLVGWRGALPRTWFWVIGDGVRGEATYPTDAGYACYILNLGRTNDETLALSKRWLTI